MGRAGLCSATSGSQMETFKDWVTWQLGLSHLEAASLPREVLMPAVGWALSWAVTQEIYMWPLHVSLSELPQNMAAGVQENKVDVPGLLMCQPQVLCVPLPLFSVDQGSDRCQPAVAERGHRWNHLLNGGVSGHIERWACDGRCCCGCLWKKIGSKGMMA